MLARSIVGWLAALALGVLLSALLLAAVELGLGLAGVGDDAPLHDPFAGFSSVVPMFERTIGAASEPVYRISPARLSPRKRREAVDPQRQFQAQKAANGFRVFVVGGSSSQGVPYPMEHAFAGWLARRLRSALPQRAVEVVNAGMSGYSSRRVLPIVHELSRFEPDLLVVYMGHNEWAETVYYAHLLEMDPRLFRLLEWGYRTRTYALLSRIVDLDIFRPAPRIGIGARRNALEMFQVLRKRADGDNLPIERERAYRDLLYEHNLRAIVRTAKRAGARVLLLTLSQNFSDWPPAASAHRDVDAAAMERWEAAFAQGRGAASRGDCASALELYRDALAIDDGSAELHFRIASCQRALGDYAAARRHYRLASDLDQVPHGAPTDFNRVIREMARSEGALLLDIDAILQAESGDWLPGDDLFVDFVHPNIRAHQLIARSIERALRDEGLPEPAERWREGYRDPPLAEIYSAEPSLEIAELHIRVVMCLMAPRDTCPDEAMRLSELDPGNKAAAEVLAFAARGDAW